MAARQLDETFSCAFSGTTTTSRITDYYGDIHKSGTHYLEIPIKNNVFEIPVVAIETFKNMTLMGSNNVDAISVAMYNLGKKARYSTPDRNMRDILMADWSSNHLVYIPVSQNGEVVDYYGSHGMLLSKDFKLLVALSWQIKRFIDIDAMGNSGVKYQVIKPILRIDPVCFSNSDPMMKWCANKLFKTGLAERVLFSYTSSIRRTFKLENVESMSPSIVIEKSPFNIRTPDVPDVLTTREEILQPVIDHIDELIQ